MIFNTALLVVREHIGPDLLTSTSESFSVENDEVAINLYYFQRVLVTLGLGNQKVEELVLVGPTRLPELTPPHNVFGVAFYKTDPQSPDDRIKVNGRLNVLTIHTTEDPSQITELKELIEQEISDYLTAAENLLVIPHLDDVKNHREMLLTLEEKLNRGIGLRKQKDSFGSSLFNLSTLSRLEEHQKKVASELVRNPDGLFLAEIAERLEMDQKACEQILADLLWLGFVETHNKDGSYLFMATDD